MHSYLQKAKNPKTKKNLENIKKTLISSKKKNKKLTILSVLMSSFTKRT